MKSIKNRLGYYTLMEAQATLHSHPKAFSVILNPAARRITEYLKKNLQIE